MSERVAGFVERRRWWMLGLIMIATAVLAVPFLLASSDEVASDEPGGPAFEARDAIETRFDGGVASFSFIIESRDQNVVTQESLQELQERSRALRDDPELGNALVTRYDEHIGSRLGVITLADRTEAALGAELHQVDEETVQQVASEIVDQVGPIAAGLSVDATRDDELGLWSSSAMVFTVSGDADAVQAHGSASEAAGTQANEAVGRQIQEIYREASSFQTWGIAIDQELTAGEQGEAAGPFIGLTVLAILILVGIAFRSYWVLSATGLGLLLLLIWLNGLANVLGMKEDQILATVVPIAMLAFGIDYAFHAIGRYREERSAGQIPSSAYRMGIGRVGGALALALTTGAAAFLANTSSGIESIVQFGITAAVGLVSAWVILGYAVPLLVMAIDERTHGRTVRGSWVLSLTGSVLAAAFAMVTVLLLVFIAPSAGLLLTAVYAGLFLLLPWLLTNVVGRAEEEPALVTETGDHAFDDHGWLERTTGRLVRFAGVRRWFVLPVVAIVTAFAAFFAVQVPASFDVEDFFDQETDFVVSLSKVDEHIGDQGGETAEIFVEADLDDPASLAAIESFTERVAGLDSSLLARSDDGTIRVERGIVDFVNSVSANGQADIRANPGEFEAVLASAKENGVTANNGDMILSPMEVSQIAAPGENGLTATRLQLHLVGSREQENISATRDLLEPYVDDLEQELVAINGDATATLTGGPVVRQASMDAVARALQTSLPIALVLCFLLAMAFMRSVRYALIATGAILLVVAWLYGFMYVAGYSVNLVTATIGAISIGIGIDFATHFIMRYREELPGAADRSEALYRTGAGTGTALVGSTFTSAAGFIILAFAPMPMFAAFGLLTALMIVFALIASLLVLPGLLMSMTGAANADDA
ncbi:MAG: hypothetical protein EA415_14610 [Sphaerobacteraceae bacterium]|nr:MAG: hypothetical protein EA415_14610 [Sphaerobacteraceae bacterium]